MILDSGGARVASRQWSLIGYSVKADVQFVLCIQAKGQAQLTQVAIGAGDFNGFLDHLVIFVESGYFS